MLFAKLYIVASFIATGLATSQNTFRSPKAKSFLNIDFNVAIPRNASTPDGVVGLTPNMGGNFTGNFDGTIIPNGAATERIVPSGLYSFYNNEILFSVGDDQNLLVNIDGIVTYGKLSLHGFGRVTFSTTIEKYKHLNYGMYIAEWIAEFGKGKGDIEIFEITTGGRKDSQPIEGLPGK